MKVKAWCVWDKKSEDIGNELFDTKQKAKDRISGLPKRYIVKKCVIKVDGR